MKVCPDAFLYSESIVLFTASTNWLDLIRIYLNSQYTKKSALLHFSLSFGILLNDNCVLTLCLASVQKPMKILEQLPPYTGEYLSICEALPPQDVMVLIVGSRRLSTGAWQRVIEKGYWHFFGYDETEEVIWYISGPDSYTLEQVTDWMVLPALPEELSPRSYTYQYSADTCPGRPCSTECDHRGVPPAT